MRKYFKLAYVLSVSLSLLLIGFMAVDHVAGQKKDDGKKSDKKAAEKAEKTEKAEKKSTEKAAKKSEDKAEKKSDKKADAKAGSAKAVAVLQPTAGNNVTGTITFIMEGKSVKVVAELEGLAPGTHGFHIHEFGDCSAPDGTSAGGHFNPAGMQHGAPSDKQRHIGDLGNIEADQNGRARVEITDAMLKFDGAGSIIGRAVIVHANADDMKTQPTGNAGGRQACGVIGLAKQ